MGGEDGMELLTIAQISRTLGIAESTVRYYRDRFSNYIPDVGTGRSRKYRPEALEILRFIADNMRSGVPVEEVESVLKARFSVNIEPQQQPVVTQQQPAAIMRELIADALQSEFQAIKGEVEAIKQENVELKKLIEEQGREQKQAAERHDQLLMQLVRQMQENARLQIAAAEEQPYKKRWFQWFRSSRN